MAIPSEIFENFKGTGVNNMRTICEVHRCLYDTVINKVWAKDCPTAEELVKLLEEAYQMGIKMDKKLREYKFNPRDEYGFLAKNDVEKVSDSRKKRISAVSDT